MPKQSVIRRLYQYVRKTHPQRRHLDSRLTLCEQPCVGFASAKVILFYHLCNKVVAFAGQPHQNKSIISSTSPQTQHIHSVCAKLPADKGTRPPRKYYLFLCCNPNSIKMLTFDAIALKCCRFAKEVVPLQAICEVCLSVSKGVLWGKNVGGAVEGAIHKRL